jgi:tRNA pseudouridine38-40 synthase
MKHICLRIAYDGSRYNGFQSQPQKNTVQDCIEEALLQVTGENIKINGSGRTDAGVHARSQYVDFFVSASVPLNRWSMAMNSCLPFDIKVLAAFEVPLEFHARRSTFAKTYKYVVNFSRISDVFYDHMQYHFPRRIDIVTMIEASQILLGEHDFTSFASANNVRRSNIRKIMQLKIEIVKHPVFQTNELIEFYITGTGFLQHMVRIIIGTLLDVGVGKKSPQDVARILEAKNRLLAGPTAPSKGLILWDVVYPEKFGITLETI